MPYTVALAPKQASSLPATRWLDMVQGKVRWIEGSGWCDQGFVEITVDSVASPTLDQIRFVQKERPYLGNFLKVRQAMQQGQYLGFGHLLPAEAREREAQLKALGFTCAVSASETWRPLTYEAGDPQQFLARLPSDARA